MKAHARKAYNELVKIGAPVMEEPWNDGHFRISGECNCAGTFGGNKVQDELWADYWEQGFGEFGVNTKITETLSKHGLYPEWQNAGVLDVYDI